MTVLDMVCLADMWVNLSATEEGTLVPQLVLPGELTGRDRDRYFRCTLRSTAMAWAPGSDWRENWECPWVYYSGSQVNWQMTPPLFLPGH